jgi:hypothetical protein
MVTYVIYDRNTGRIVHTHVQTGDLPLGREGLISLVDRSHDLENLDTLVVDPAQMKEDYLYRVEPKSKQLEQVDSKAASGSGAGAARHVSADWATGPFKVTYSRAGSEPGSKR